MSNVIGLEVSLKNIVEKLGDKLDTAFIVFVNDNKMVVDFANRLSGVFEFKKISDNEYHLCFEKGNINIEDFREAFISSTGKSVNIGNAVYFDGHDIVLSTSKLPTDRFDTFQFWTKKEIENMETYISELLITLVEWSNFAYEVI